MPCGSTYGLINSQYSVSSLFLQVLQEQTLINELLKLL